jgi:hypothetical protein
LGLSASFSWALRAPIFVFYGVYDVRASLTYAFLEWTYVSLGQIFALLEQNK